MRAYFVGSEHASISSGREQCSHGQLQCVASYNFSCLHILRISMHACVHGRFVDLGLGVHARLAELLIGIAMGLVALQAAIGVCGGAHTAACSCDGVLDVRCTTATVAQVKVEVGALVHKAQSDIPREMSTL